MKNNTTSSNYTNDARVSFWNFRDGLGETRNELWLWVEILTGGNTDRLNKLFERTKYMYYTTERVDSKTIGFDIFITDLDREKQEYINEIGQLLYEAR